MAELLDKLERHTDKMQTILMVREPSSAAAADAYEGLRRQVVNAVSARSAHLAQLAELDTAIAHGADRDVLAKLVDAWFHQAALVRVDDPGHPQAELIFELLVDEGGPLVVTEPAYLDAHTSRLVRPGRAHRRRPEPAGEPAPDDAASDDSPHDAGRVPDRGTPPADEPTQAAGDEDDRRVRN